jgi:tetratricopeptide (TPR) repeat protein
MEWGLAADDPERARRLASVLLWLWYLRGHTNEGVDFLRRAIDRAPDDRTWVQPNLCAGVAAVSVASGQTDLMLEYSLRGLEVATAIGDEDVRASCLLLLGVAQSFLDFDAARELFDQAQRAAELGQQNPSRPGVSRMTANRLVVMQGVLHAYRDRYDDARPLLQEGYERCLGRGDRGFASVALDYLAVAALVGGDPHRGEELATQAYEIAQPRGDYYDVGRAAARLALVKTFTGDLATGWQVTEPIVRSVEGTTHTLYVPRLAQAMGRLSLLAGDFERSVAWYERDVRDEGPMADSHITAQSLPGLAGALRHLGRVDEARARAERGLALARRLGTPQLTADALEQLAHLVGPDDPKQAEDLHHEALAVRVEHGLRLFQVDSLDALAGLAARVESFAEAARLLVASDAARAEMGYPRPTIDAPDNDALVARLRSALGAPQLVQTVVKRGYRLAVA